MLDKEILEGAGLDESAGSQFIWARAKEAVLRLEPGDQLVKMCSTLCSALVDVFKFPAARLWLRTMPGGCSVCPGAPECPKTACYRLICGVGAHDVIGFGRDTFGTGMYLEGKVAASAEPYVTNLVLQESDLVRQSYAERQRLVAYAAYPLVQDKEAIGVVSLFSFYNIDAKVNEALEFLFHAAALGISGALERVLMRRQAAHIVQPGGRDWHSGTGSPGEGGLITPEFVKKLSHEIKTHANNLVPLVDLIAAETSNEQYAKVSDAARDLFEMLEEVLTLMRLDAGTLVLHSEPGNVGAALRGMIERCGPLAEPRRQRLEFVEPSMPVAAVFDETALLLVLSILVENACRNSPEGARIGVTMEKTPREVLVGVRDEGPGVAEELGKVLFSPFGRGEHGFQKHGLNLAIARAFVELWGGVIWFSNLPGGGSEFVFTLPSK